MNKHFYDIYEAQALLKNKCLDKNSHQQTHKIHNQIQVAYVNLKETVTINESEVLKLSNLNCSFQIIFYLCTVKHRISASERDV